MTRTNNTPVINNLDLNNITNHGEEENTAKLNSQKLKKTYRSSSCVKLPSGNLSTRCPNTKKCPFKRGRAMNAVGHDITHAAPPAR
jgi:hypothetical protein